jgi:hypothetical protein
MSNQKEQSMHPTSETDLRKLASECLHKEGANAWPIYRDEVAERALDSVVRKTAAKKRLSLEGVYSESHECIDCGVNTCPGAPPRALAEILMERHGAFPIEYSDECEVYIVRESVWEKAGMQPWGGCLCIGCLERRLGRTLKRKDFPEHPFRDLPATPRLRERRGS